MLSAWPSRWAGLRALALAAAAALVLAACHRTPPPPSNATPEKAVATNLRLTATGDFDGLLRNRLPPAAYAQWRRDWNVRHAQPPPVSATQRQQFADILQALTAPQAEARLLKQLQPQLANGGGKGLPPVLASVLTASVKSLIETSPQLGPRQRTLALQVLAAIEAKAATVNFADKHKLTKAIALLCHAARDLHVTTLAQWQALDYATTMRDYGIIWNALQAALRVYGIDLPRGLTTAKPMIVSIAGADAQVQLHLTVAGTPMTAQWTLHEEAGHWYDAAMLAAWRQAHPAAATSVAAPASSAGPPPASALEPGAPSP